MPKQVKDFVVYLFDDAHKKQYIYGNKYRTYINTNPKNAREFTHNEAVRLLMRHGLVNGGGFENKVDAYTDYITNNDVPLDQI